MSSLEDVLRWISGNEALLSGIAALIAIGGLVVSPIGGVLRRRAVHRRKRSAAEPGGEAKAEGSAAPDATRPQRVVAVLPFDNVVADVPGYAAATGDRRDCTGPLRSLPVAVVMPQHRGQLGNDIALQRRRGGVGHSTTARD